MVERNGERDIWLVGWRMYRKLWQIEVRGHRTPITFPHCVSRSFRTPDPPIATSGHCRHTFFTSFTRTTKGRDWSSMIIEKHYSISRQRDGRSRTVKTSKVHTNNNRDQTESPLTSAISTRRQRKARKCAKDSISKSYKDEARTTSTCTACCRRRKRVVQLLVSLQLRGHPCKRTGYVVRIGLRIPRQPGRDVLSSSVLT